MAGGQRIAWPENLKHTTTRDNWYKRFSKLRPGLSLQQVSRLLKQSYASVYRWADVFEYSFPDLRERGRVAAAKWEQVDWSLRDAEIARELGVSRERIRQVRAARGVGPSSHRLTVKEFHRWVKTRRQKLNGVPVSDALRAFGQDISPQVARRVLRLVGVQPHDPGAHWREVDWRLPNRDLAQIWNTSPKYVANIRARLKVGPAKWEPSRAMDNGHARYHQALVQEKQKAKAARAMIGQNNK